MTDLEKTACYLDTLETVRTLKEKQVPFFAWLTGSAGWGIPEGGDEMADNDFLVVADDGGEAHTDSVHSGEFMGRKTFVQFRSLSWLNERLFSPVSETAIVYNWILRNATPVSGTMPPSPLLQASNDWFNENLDQYRAQMLITFGVREYDLKSAWKRQLVLAQSIYLGEYLRATLRLICLLHGQPFPYNKWLEKQADLLEGNAELSSLLADAARARSYDELKLNLQQVKTILRNKLHILQNDRFNDMLERWWIYNQN